MEELNTAWDAYDESSKILHEAIEKLNRRSQDQVDGELGLSPQFKQKTAMTEALAIKLCERAMDNLAGIYVDTLTTFVEAQDPIVALTNLEDAEVMWKSQTSLIKRFDASGTETEFFQDMRQKAHMVLERKLQEAAAASSKDANPENVALCIGIMAVIDGIYEERGVDVKAEPRQKLRQLVRGFR